MSKKRKYAIVLISILWFLVVGTIVGIHFEFFDSHDSDDDTYERPNLSFQEIDDFNSRFSPYEGKITRSRVKDLIQLLIANAKKYTEEPAKIPSVKYVTSENDDSDVKDWQESDEGGKVTSSVLKSNPEGQKDYTNALLKLQNGLVAEHTYFVELNTNAYSIIDEVIIYYDSVIVTYNSI